MIKGLKTRVQRLELSIGNEEILPTAIIFSVQSAKKLAGPFSDDLITGLKSDDAELERLPGETVAELDTRAEAYPPRMPGSIRVWIYQYKKELEC